MSVEIMTRVWKHSKAKGGNLLILLAMADFSNDDGYAWPAMSTLAKKGRMTERNAQFCVRDLEKKLMELRVIRGQGPHGTNLFQLITPEDTLWVENISGENISGENISGEKLRINGVKPTSPNPSLDPSLKEKENIPSLSPQTKKTRLDKKSNGPTNLPDDFKVREIDKAWFVDRQKKGQVHFDPGTAHEEFMNYWRSKGIRRKEWHLTWRNWMIKAEEIYIARHPNCLNGSVTPGNPSGMAY